MMLLLLRAHLATLRSLEDVLFSIAIPLMKDQGSPAIETAKANILMSRALLNVESKTDFKMSADAGDYIKTTIGATKPPLKAVEGGKPKAPIPIRKPKAKPPATEPPGEPPTQGPPAA
jgi:hypothetical protein